MFSNRYYTMDCMALHQLSSKRQMWSNFKHLLILQSWVKERFLTEICRIIAFTSNNPITNTYYLLTLRKEFMDKKKFIFAHVCI